MLYDIMRGLDLDFLSYVISTYEIENSAFSFQLSHSKRKEEEILRPGDEDSDKGGSRRKIALTVSRNDAKDVAPTCIDTEEGRRKWTMQAKWATENL